MTNITVRKVITLLLPAGHTCLGGGSGLTGPRWRRSLFDGRAPLSRSATVRRLAVVTLALTLLVTLTGIAPAQAATASTFTAKGPSAAVVQLSPASILGRLTPGRYRAYKFQKLVRGTWLTIHTGKTNSSGYTRLKVSTTRTGVTRYRYYGPATSRQKADFSSVVTITVKAGISARLSSNTVRKGQSASMTGRVLPVMSGRAIYLQRSYHSVWRTVAGTRTNAHGNYQFTLPTTTVGIYWYRVRMPKLSASRPASTIVVPDFLVVGPNDPYVTNFTCKVTNKAAQKYTISFTLNRPRQAPVPNLVLSFTGGPWLGNLMYNGVYYFVDYDFSRECGLR